MTELRSKRRWYQPTLLSILVGLLFAELIVLFDVWWFLWRGQSWLPSAGWSEFAVVVALLACFGCLAWICLSRFARRRFQFSLRTLLVMVLLLSLPVNWYAGKLRQKRVVSELQKVGGRAVPTGFFASVDSVWFEGQVTDADLKRLERLPRIRDLQLFNTQITDSGLAHLRTLKNLRSLDLSGLPITDKGLVHLKNLKRLEFLKLSDTQVTDNGITHLKGLTNLRILLLHGTAVTPQGQLELCQALRKCNVQM